MTQKHLKIYKYSHNKVEFHSRKRYHSLLHSFFLRTKDIYWKFFLFNIFSFINQRLINDEFPKNFPLNEKFFFLFPLQRNDNMQRINCICICFLLKLQICFSFTKCLFISANYLVIQIRNFKILKRFLLKK